MSGEEELVLLYDGLCGYCDRMVRFILSRDRGGAMRFAPLQGEFARDLLARHPELASVDSLVLVERTTAGEQLSTRSEAVIRIWRYVGGPWKAVTGLRLVPRPIRDWCYDLFARWRGRLFARYDSCPVPGPEVRARYLD